MTPLTIYRRKN